MTKKSLYLAALLVLLVAVAAVLQDRNADPESPVTASSMVSIGVNLDPLPIGSKAPMTDVALMGASGQQQSLSQIKGENGLLVVFSANTCPWVNEWADRYAGIAEQAAANGVGVAVINSNADYRDNGDGLADMKKMATENGYTFPYLLDERNRIADAFGASKTPSVFLFDGTMALVYQGAIDDNARNPAEIDHHYVRDAITAMVAGQAVAVPTSRAIGCTIKRI